MRRQSPQRGAHSPRADGHFFFVAMAFGVLPFVTSLILGRPMQALVAGVIQHGAAAGYRGFDVRETATGRDTLRLARLQVHAIVLDLVLSDMNGYEVLRKMKDDPATHNIPVIMKTTSR